MGAGMCCVEKEVENSSGSANKLRISQKEKSDLSKKQSKQQQQDQIQSNKQSIDNPNDQNIAVYERLSEIETKEVQPASFKKRSQKSLSMKKNSTLQNVGHYSPEVNITDQYLEGQENNKNLLGEDISNNQVIQSGVSPKPNRREFQEGQNFKTYCQERNLDLSNTPYTQNMANTQHYSQQNNMSQSNISEISTNQNQQTIKQKSPYTTRMEEFLMVSVKDMSHHYNSIDSSISKSKKKKDQALSKADQKKLHGKIEAELKNTLKVISCDEENGGVFFAYDSNNIQYIKVLIIGASHTPFAYGAYIFDMFIPDDYPKNPPRLKFQSTQKGTVRFSPLLPTDGRVCLSILNIQNGQGYDASEQWSEYTSNILQVIQTIQSQIFNENLYYQEPSTMDYKKNNKNESSINVSDMYNLGYANVARYANMVYSIEEAIKVSDSNQKEFMKVIQTHFVLTQNDVIERVSQWISSQDNLSDEDLKPLYSGIVQQHNPAIVKQLQDNGFCKLAISQKKNIIQQLKKISSLMKDSKSSLN